jgi:tetratricopeptide (TPR) repeat protein
MKQHDSNRKRFDELLREGSRHLQHGNHERAKELLEQAHLQDPSHFEASLNLSGAYLLGGKFKKAVVVLEGLVEQEPDNAMVWTNLGAAYLGNPVLARDEEQSKAIVAFKRALELDSTAPHVAYNLGLIYRDRGESEEAIRWFEQALQTKPDDRDARNILRRLKSGEDRRSTGLADE